MLVSYGMQPGRQTLELARGHSPQEVQALIAKSKRVKRPIDNMPAWLATGLKQGWTRERAVGARRVGVGV
jgi:hypothetical protein